jgi:hypothetical protein
MDFYSFFSTCEKCDHECCIKKGHSTRRCFTCNRKLRVCSNNPDYKFTDDNNNCKDPNYVKCPGPTGKSCDCAVIEDSKFFCGSRCED